MGIEVDFAPAAKQGLCFGEFKQRASMAFPVQGRCHRDVVKENTLRCLLQNQDAQYVVGNGQYPDLTIGNSLRVIVKHWSWRLADTRDIITIRRIDNLSNRVRISVGSWANHWTAGCCSGVTHWCIACSC